MPDLVPARRMAQVVEGLARDFAHEHGLTHLGPYDLFETFTAYCIVKRYHREFDADDLRSGGSRAGGQYDHGIDAYAVIINGRLFTEPSDVAEFVAQQAQLEVRFIVIQAKRRIAFEGDAFTKLAIGVERLFGPDELPMAVGKGVRRLRECARAVYADLEKLEVHGLPRLDAWYATLGRYRPRAHQGNRELALKRLQETGLFRFVEIRGAGARDLRDAYRNDGALMAVKFAMPATKRVEVPAVRGATRTLLGIVHASEIVDKVLLDEQGVRRPHLFDDNLRDFLGTVRYPVNQEIEATLRDDDRRGRFAMLNNGITIVAQTITTDPRDVLLRGPQIVNGCQTCYVLLNNRHLLTSDVMVNVRIIQSTDETVVSSIVRATNRQTAINEHDLDAGEPFQRHLEDYFATREPGRQIFYQRRVQQYGSSKMKARIINRRHLTQAYAATWLGLPERVTRYVSLVRDRPDIFQDAHDGLPYYVSAVAYLNVERLFGKGIPSAFRPARFHLLHGIKLLAAGSREPQPVDPELERACDRLIEILWDPDALLEVINILLRVVDRILNGANLAGLDALVRTDQFSDAFKRAVLELPRLT